MPQCLNVSILGTKRRIGESKVDYQKRFSESVSVNEMETLARLEDKKLTPSVTKPPSRYLLRRLVIAKSRGDSFESSRFGSRSV